MQALTLAIIRFGLLALLWLFVLAAIRVIRADLFPRPARPANPPAAAPARPTPRQQRRSAARRLVVVEGPESGGSVALGEAPVTVGRAPDCTLVLSDNYVSNEHARLVPGGDRWLVEDLGSTNGTWLDRQKVAGPTPVPIGVPVRVGKTTLELRR